MENLGALAILLAFCLSLFAVAASLAGKYGRRPFLAVSGERAVYSVWVLLTVAAGLLVYSLITGDFRIAYVQAHSDRAMSPLYKFTAWWGGQEGSLLLWSWILASYSAVAVWTSRIERELSIEMRLRTRIQSMVWPSIDRRSVRARCTSRE